MAGIPTVNGSTFPSLVIDHENSSFRVGWLVLSGTNFDDDTSANPSSLTITGQNSPTDPPDPNDPNAGWGIVTGTESVISSTMIRVRIQYTPGNVTFDTIGQISVTITNTDSGGAQKVSSPPTKVKVLHVNVS
jgi:hypothetical protein